MKRCFAGLSFLPILVTMLFLGCSGSKGVDEERIPTADTGPAYGDVLVEGSIGDASNLIPILASDSTSHAIAALIYNGLVKYDKDLNVVGDLAESWEVSQGGLVITFRLRKDVKWHDGKPFTADDVLYTYRVTIDPKTPTAYSGDFLKVKKAEVIDPYTFRASYDRPFAPALTSWSAAILPKHLLEGQTSPGHLFPGTRGTGPYMFKEWLRAENRLVSTRTTGKEGLTSTATSCG
jgi:peptide/nickel transport system substrate-binding protein